MLQDLIRQRTNGIVLYGITPPKAQNTPEKIAEIAATQVERIRSLGVDGLVLYDIQDEADRTSEARPFPFIETLDPVMYAAEHLASLELPKITYRCTAKYSPESFTAYLQAQQQGLAVFVGAASRQQRVTLTMNDAYALRQQHSPGLLLGGVAIPERHLVKQDEHLRVAAKMAQGCSYFITQCVYNVEAAKTFLSDYYYHCREHGIDMVPIIFTITPCGSVKTLQFMKWLGISIPKWLENDLSHSVDILGDSLHACRSIFAELIEYAASKQIPIGCNVESVAIRKDEIEASLQLVRDVQAMLGRGRGS